MVSALAHCHKIDSWMVVRVVWDTVSPLFQVSYHVLPLLSIVCDSRLRVRRIYPFYAVNLNLRGKFRQLEEVDCA